MTVDDVQPRSALPLGHKLFAGLIALAVAGAGCAWLFYQSEMAASTAVLAFSPSLARQMDPGIASAKNPAIALADSILNDRTVAAMAKQANLASPAAAALGEFRSGLQLTQPSATRLAVRFQDTDSSRSVTVANAVAQALAAWTPSPAALTQTATAAQAPEPATTSEAQGEATPPPTAPAATPQSAPTHPLADSLDKLGAQLSATNRALTKISGAAAPGANHDDQSSYIEANQQSLLRKGVGEAKKTLRDLRALYAQQAAGPNVKGRLNEVQQALDSILPGPASAGLNGFNMAGVSTRQLRAEQSELQQAISIVHAESQAIRRVEAENPAPASQNKVKPSTAPAAQPPAAQPPAAQPSSIQEQNLPPVTPAHTLSEQPSQNPLTVVRLAGRATQPPLWAAIVAGLLCGGLYLAVAAFAYRQTGAEDEIDPEETSVPHSPVSHRLITPSEPIRNIDISSTPAQPRRVEAQPRQRASFQFQQAPPESNPPLNARVEPAGATVDPTSAAAEPHGTTNEPSVQNVEPEPVALGKDDPAPVAAAVTSLPEQVPELSSAENVAAGDPVTDRIRMSIAETSIGKMLAKLEREPHKDS